MVKQSIYSGNLFWTGTTYALFLSGLLYQIFLDISFSRDMP